jgi:hypothetical protein
MCNNALKILSDENTFKTFKANALIQAKKFDIDKIVPQYEKMYESILNGN